MHEMTRPPATLTGRAGRFSRATLRRLSDARLDIAIVLALTALAAALRLPDLGDIPYGFHGDEAWTGLDARRILDEGWIGPYVDSALGQPAGPLYFTAATFKLFGESIFTIRLSMALLGIATIPAAYGAFALMFGRSTGALAAVILATMTWHLHLSRLGFMVISWPLMEMLVLLTLWWAFRSRNVWLYVASGLLLGLGLMTYNAYPLFVPLPFIALLWMFFRRPAPERIRYVAMALAFAAAALLGAAPLLRYIDAHEEDYRYHQRTVALANSPAWEDADLSGRADILWTRAEELHEGLVLGFSGCGRPQCFVLDFGDGTGAADHPHIEPLIYVFALVGLALAVWRIGRPQYAVLVAAVLILPWGALLTVEWGMYRRTFGLAPFVAALAAVPLAMIWDVAVSRREAWARFLLGAAVAAVPVYAGVTAVERYFTSMQDTEVLQFTMGGEFRAAVEYADTLPDGTLVYFYSRRWAWEYESKRFMAPHLGGIDRSTQFRRPQHEGPLDLSAGARGVVYLFLDDYAAQLEQVQRQYPGGEAYEETRDGRLMFRAYYLGPDPERR